MATDVERLFHETWLGETQPHEGLTFSVPVLCDGGVMLRLDAAQARAFAEQHTVEHLKSGGGRAIQDLRSCLLEFFDWNDDELHDPERMPEDLLLRVAEEGTELRPTLAVPRVPLDDAAEQPPNHIQDAGEQTPASRAGAGYQMLIWELPIGLDLDAPEAETTQWHYPPSAKFERLLRETRVPIGLLSNGVTLRLLYCPTGQSTGWISFDVAYMCSSAGRDMLSALRELLHAGRVLGSLPDTPTTLELLQLSRDRQADVSTRLGEQALDALQILLEGFEAAAHRDGDQVLREAMRVEGNHVYEGLLTVVLRLIFSLYAEDLGLLPVEHPIYTRNLGVNGLYADLVTDADAYGDTMDQRFGAWPRLIMLFRSLYFGLELAPVAGGAAPLSMPPHRGRLFNPENYPFLEGWIPGGGAPTSAEARAAMRLPSIADGVVYRVLQRLLFLDGQRLSYSALETEQLGSAYESLMGFAVERRMAWSVCLAPSRVWVSPRDLLDQPKATRVRWLQDAGVTASSAKRLVAAIDELEDQHDRGPDLDDLVLAKLREFSVAPPRKRSRDDHPARAEVGPDRLVIQPGEERRRTSSHYTPSSLSGPIVARTLEPLLAAIRARVAQEHPDDPDPQPSAEDLLNLKICDPAMGSGAFLVESCRFLARQLVAAWVREGTLEQEIDKAGDEAARRKPEQLAMRVVAQRCLYGVDKNPLAVELGKLSLWLLTLARGQTFTFLDHCLKAGDSLVGLSKSQILALDWSPEVAKPVAKPAKGKKKKSSRKQADDGEQAQLGLFSDQAKRAFDKATLARQKLAALAARSDRADVEREQHELHVEAERALERVRDVADILLSSYFWPVDTGHELTPEFLFAGGKLSDKQRQACLARVRDEVNFWLMGGGDSRRLPRELEVRRALVRDCIRPMHWELEFPEVFSEGRRDSLAEEGVGLVWMDAVVGNPPFSGKVGITSAHGPVYLTWLTSAYTPSHGNSDLSAYFFRRAAWMLGAHGTLGLIATNTIGQGDTRTTGLQPLVEEGARIYDAIRDMKWPVKGANVSVSVVCAAKGTANHDHLISRLDGDEVAGISSQLRPGFERVLPARLDANQGRSFQGTIVLGKGFLLTPDERETLATRNPANSERIRPYLGGQELNTSPTHSHHRYVINFGNMALRDVEAWPDLLEIVRAKVKPERDKQKDNADGRRRKEYWWQFGRNTPALYDALGPLDRCLACSSVSKYSVFAFQPTDRVFAHTLIVFPLPAYAHFGLLQSRIHELWARLHGSSMRNDLRYTPSDCFETFPFPDERTLAETAPLEAIAKQLYESRAQYMIDTDQGLTKTYNALKDPNNTDPEVQHLRELHEQLDRAVLDAYGQSIIPVPPYAGASPEQLERFEDAVLDFLFAANQKLAKLEAQQRAKSAG